MTLLGPDVQLQMSFVSFKGKSFKGSTFKYGRAPQEKMSHSHWPPSVFLSNDVPLPSLSLQTNKVKEPELEMVFLPIGGFWVFFFCHFKDAVVALVPQPLCHEVPMTVPWQGGQPRSLTQGSQHFPGLV